MIRLPRSKSGPQDDRAVVWAIFERVEINGNVCAWSPGKFVTLGKPVENGVIDHFSSSARSKGECIVCSCERPITSHTSWQVDMQDIFTEDSIALCPLHLNMIYAENPLDNGVSGWYSIDTLKMQNRDNAD
jgi:hypothetical protein